MPESIANKPELMLGLSLYWQAFYHLDSCRLNGYGMGAIPYTAILEYCRENEIEGEQRRRTVKYIRSMDEVWREKSRSNQETK